MKINPKLLPDNIRRCMPREDRKSLETPTATEAVEQMARGEELALHGKFEDWCRLNNIITVHCRTDRKATIAAGHPDFTLLRGGSGCCVEFKAEGGKLSTEQQERLQKLEEAHVPWVLASNLETAIAFVRRHLQMETVDRREDNAHRSFQ